MNKYLTDLIHSMLKKKTVLDFVNGCPPHIVAKAEELQKEMLAFIDALQKEKPSISREDCVTVFFLLKIAQLQDKH